MSTSTIVSERERAKQILGEIVRQSGGLISKADLVRSFWRAHLIYAETQPGYLSFWPLLRTSSGPAIQDADRLLGELVADGTLWIDETSANGMSALRLAPSDPDAVSDSLPAEGREAIEQAIALAEQPPDLADYRSLRSWKETAEGRELSIYLDLDPMPQADYEEQKRRLQEMAAVLSDAWS